MTHGIRLLNFILLVFICVLCGCESVRINNHSMEPTLSPGDIIHIHKYDGHQKLGSRIFVFFFPYGDFTSSYKISTNNVFIKRCIGEPGDTISIKEGVIYNNGSEIKLFHSAQTTPVKESDKDVITNCPFHRGDDRYNMSSVYIPRCGDQIVVDHYTIHLYNKVFLFESGNIPRIGDYYTFKNNYFFSCGDNMSESWDSRFWGFIPESFIIGYI